MAGEYARGEIWVADFDPVLGHEQAGTRPALIVSSDGFHSTQTGLVIVVSLTRRSRGWSTHVPIPSGSTGLDYPSFALTEQIRSVSTSRLGRYIGRVDAEIQGRVDAQLRRLLNL